MRFCVINIILILIIIFWKHSEMDEYFYDPKLFSNLRAIKPYENHIIKECLNLYSNNKKWIDWPEKSLYKNKDNWKIYPLFAFGSWADKNCSMVPSLTKYLKSIPDLKIALLSKLGSKTSLESHQGWGKYSNHILRCHYGIKIPPNCYMAVKNKSDKKYNKKYHKYKEWLVFDDSKLHYADNKSNQERLILIIDLVRPNFVAEGTSKIQYSEELINMINEFKKSL